MSPGSREERPPRAGSVSKVGPWVSGLGASKVTDKAGCDKQALLLKHLIFPLSKDLSLGLRLRHRKPEIKHFRLSLAGAILAAPRRRRWRSRHVCRVPAPATPSDRERGGVGLRGSNNTQGPEPRPNPFLMFLF